MVDIAILRAWLMALSMIRSPMVAIAARGLQI